VSRTYETFLKQFAGVIQQYGSDKFPTSALTFINDKTQDLSDLEMGQLVRAIYENCKYAPNPHATLELVRAIRSRRNGAYNQQPTYEENCKACGDLGILSAIGISCDARTLVRCNCNDGSLSNRNLPIRDRELAKEFTFERCPPEWFKPPGDKAKWNGVMEYWRGQIHIAEMFWADRLKRAE
jgi:hypothetical protein